VQATYVGVLVCVGHDDDVHDDDDDDEEMLAAYDVACILCASPAADSEPTVPLEH